MCDFVLLLLFIWRDCKDVANVIYFENTMDDKKKSNRKKTISYVQWLYSIRCKIIMNNISFLLLPLPSAVAVSADDAAVAFVWVVFSIFVFTVKKKTGGQSVSACRD